MDFTVRSFLSFLRKLVSFFRRRWDQSTRRLWYIFALLCSRAPPPCSKKNEVHRPSTKSRSTKPRPTLANCASRLPPSSAPIVDIPVVDPSTTIQLATLGSGATLHEIHENQSTRHLDVGGMVIQEIGQTSESLDSAGRQDEPEPIHAVQPPNGEDPALSSFAISSRSHPTPPTLYPGPRASSYTGHHSESQSSLCPPSEYSYRSPTNQSGAEAATRGYFLAPPFPALSAGPPFAASNVDSRPSPIPPLPCGRLRPTIAIYRYGKRQRAVIVDDFREYTHYPVSTQFVGESTPENWIPLVHPEGALYWVHREDPVYTDTNMRDPVLRQRIEEALAEINELRETSPPLPAGDWELALELGEDSETGEIFCSYYFACHSTRCLFWLHQFDLLRVLFELCGATESTHIHIALQSRYWYHWEIYPHDREVPENVIQELLGILVHASVDCITSRAPTPSLPEGDISKFIGYVTQISSVGGNYGFSACVVGRLLAYLTHSRFVNFYGQTGARVTNDRTRHDYEPKRTYTMKTLFIFLFYTPEFYLKGLESTYWDYSLSRWERFTTRLQDDWTGFVLYGTLLLNANVAFLALPSVDPGNRTRSPTQVASYLSIITSIGSIVVGLLLLRRHKTKLSNVVEEVDERIRSLRYKTFGFETLGFETLGFETLGIETLGVETFGFETLALLYSLPYSLLLWSTIAFTTAFSLETILSSRQKWAKLPVGIVLAIVILLISWCVRTTMGPRSDFSVLGRVHLLKDRLVDFTRRLRGKTPEPGPDAGDGEGGNRQSEGRSLQQSGTLMDAFKFLRGRRRHRPRRQQHSSESTSTGVEMSEIRNGPENEV